MSVLVIAPLLVALVTGILTLGLRIAPRLQRAVAVAGVAAYAGVVGLLVARVLHGPIRIYEVSGWPAPYGITLVADALAAFMLAMTAVVAVAATVFAIAGIGRFGQRIAYHPLAFFMLGGATGAFLTGDIFNLFVWFEVMLLPSYVLVVFYGEEQHTAAALRYVALNLFGSAIMLVSIGGLYATTGTLNMADMSRRLARAGTEGAAIADPTPVIGLAALLFAVFALKAGLVPFHFWVPSAYRAAPAPATAMLAGITKKVGVYAIIRMGFTVFAGLELPTALQLPGFAGESALAFFGPLLFVAAVASILLGGIAAASRDELDEVFAYSSIGQVGFIVLPVAVAATAADPVLTQLGIVAALVYALNHALAKSLLFLASGTLRKHAGTTRLSELGGLTAAQPYLSGAVLIGALALIGVPPLTGFFGKLLVFDTGVQATLASEPGAILALAVALLGAVLTIAYLSRVWNRAFWGEPSELIANMRLSPVLVGVVIALALAIVALGVGFQPVLEGARAAADAATAGDAYADAVLGVSGS